MANHQAYRLSPHERPRQIERTEPYSEFEDITPEIAMKYMDTNKSNRTLMQAVVDRYARDMSNGQWKLTHQGIGFNLDGDLIDGQHRLWGIVESGKTIRLMVTRNLDPDSNEGIDGGRNRTPVDILHYKGVKVGRLEVGIAKRLLAAEIHSRLAPNWLNHSSGINPLFLRCWKCFLPEYQESCRPR